MSLADSPIFFSEYIEGSSNSKAVEIYNNTNQPIDLSQVVVERYNNGSTTVSLHRDPLRHPGRRRRLGHRQRRLGAGHPRRRRRRRAQRVHLL
ncbi:MAG: lamin tail domain-containing protein [bacterium]|nr:lamin tail domain-containing protein [bacterium]